jgi:phenylalanyl-tRNA synthetase beta chain
LSLFISGDKTEENWHHKQNPTNFFFLKGIVFSILERLGIEHWKSAVITSALISDGLQLSVGKNSIVEFGILDSNLVNNFGIKQTLYFADFNWDKLLDVISKQTIKFKSIPKHPAVRRDFALLINEDVRFESIHKLAFETEKKILQKVNLFDVYKGKNLPEGKKSYAVSFLFQNNEKTLTDKEIDKIMSKLQNRLEKELKAELR